MTVSARPVSPDYLPKSKKKIKKNKSNRSLKNRWLSVRETILPLFSGRTFLASRSQDKWMGSFRMGFAS
jgi:hypothetical protein